MRRYLAADVVRYPEVCGGVLSGTIHDEYGMGALFDMATDLVDMELHGFSIGKRQCESRPGTTCRADGAEQVGALVALVSRLAGPHVPSRHKPTQIMHATAGFYCNCAGASFEAKLTIVFGCMRRRSTTFPFIIQSGNADGQGRSPMVATACSSPTAGPRPLDPRWCNGRCPASQI